MPNYRKGFTLIELLVVVSIIALLSSIVLSQLSSARARAADTAKIREMIVLRDAALQYAADKGNLPPVNTSNGVGSLDADFYTPLLSGSYLQFKPKSNPAYYVHRCDWTTPCTVPAGVMTNSLFFTSCPASAEAVIIFTLENNPPYGAVPWGSYYALCF